MDQPKKPKELPQGSVKKLQERLADEYTAHFFYTHARNWCQGVSYKKAAAFFAQEAANELEHATKLQKYLVDWNIVPEIPAFSTNIKFNSLIDIVNLAYTLEYGLWEKYNADSKELFNSDIATYDFLEDYRKGQTESVIEYSDLLNAAELVDVNNKLDLLYFENTYF